MPLRDPLQEITDWASNIRQGDFSARLKLSNKQFSSTEDDINRLADWLESLAKQSQEELSNRENLIQSQSDSLKLVYDITSGLNKTYDAKGFISQYLTTLKELSGATRADAFLHDRQGRESLLASLEDEGAIERTDENCMVVPLSVKDRLYGEYRLYMDQPVTKLTDSTRELLSNIGLNLGMALEKQEQEQDSMMLGRVSERTAFAHELHDSMAQTLASLRFQVRILDGLLQDVTKTHVWMQMETVEKLVDLAHQELRSLIGQFRAPIEVGNLSGEMKKILARFRTESGIPAFFQNQCEAIQFPEETQIAIIRVAQESLKNICKHSQAETVRILLRQQSNTQCMMLVEDDGVGFGFLPDREHAGMHIGLSVMKERAEQIGGSLSIESEKGEGTRIMLTFPLT
jgi:two-component system nitrate/nitrite sensor histidine kinase NarX